MFMLVLCRLKFRELHLRVDTVFLVILVVTSQVSIIIQLGLLQEGRKKVLKTACSSAQSKSVEQMAMTLALLSMTTLTR